jgi:hypothetical protein
MRLRRDGRRPVVFEGVPLATFTARVPLPAPLHTSNGPTAEDDDSPGEAGSGPSRTGAGWHGADRREDATAEQTLAFFLARDGRVIAQLRLLVPEQSAARPVHRVAELASREDLRRFLAGYRPEDAFWVGSRTPPPGGDGWRVAALKTLRAEFARLTAPLRDSFGECHR